MRVFVTGASGFVGSAVVAELLAAGHQVLGLARSDAAAAAVAASGAEVIRGGLEDLDGLRSAAASADGVIHTAFIHDFSDFARSTAVDQQAITALGETLAGSGRPLVVTAGMAALTPGRPSTEEDAPNPHIPRVSEQAAIQFAERGVRASVMRLPPSVHGKGDHGFVPRLIEIARERGVSGYVGEGANAWAAVHRLDAARLFRLALEGAPAGARLHAVGDEGVPTRAIAEVIGRWLRVPVVSVPAEQAGEHFGWLGSFFSMDVLASGALTEQRYGWQPAQPGLLADLDHAYYFGGAR